MNQEKGITVVWITHFMDEAVKADRVLVMNDGEIILDSNPRDAFTRVELIKSVGLDVPQASELCYKLRLDGLELPEDILNEEECINALVKAAEG